MYTAFLLAVREGNVVRQLLQNESTKESEHSGRRYTPPLELYDIAVGQVRGEHPKTDLRVLDQIGFNNFLECYLQNGITLLNS